MSLHLQRDLTELKKNILLLGSMVEKAINNAILALNNREVEMAEKVINDESAIDEKEVQIEEECMKILALHQPVAADLRFIVSVLKVNNDLERMGDFAVNIANRAIYLTQFDPLIILPEFIETLPVLVRTMVRDALDALVKLDVKLANKVIDMDDQIDDINRRMYKQVTLTIVNDPETVDRAINLLSTSRYLERIGDLSTNIAEYVLFMVQGNVARHQTD